MRKFILILLIILNIPLSSYAEANEYPKIETRNDTTFIVFTYQQGQEIDYKLELLEHYKKIAENCDKTTFLQVEVEDNYKNIIATNKVQIEKLETIISNFETVVKDLKYALIIKDYELKNNEEIIKKQQFIIDEYKLDVKKEKRRKLFTYVTSTTVTIGAIFFAIFK